MTFAFLTRECIWNWILFFSLKTSEHFDPLRWFRLHKLQWHPYASHFTEANYVFKVFTLLSAPSSLSFSSLCLLKHIILPTLNINLHLYNLIRWIPQLYWTYMNFGLKLPRSQISETTIYQSLCFWKISHWLLEILTLRMLSKLSIP